MILKKNIAVVAESHDSLAKLPFGNQDLAMVSQESETMGLLSSPRLEESVRDQSPRDARRDRLPRRPRSQSNSGPHPEDTADPG